MKFVRKNINTNKYVDNIFSISKLAKNDKDAIDATEGCLFDENNNLFTYSTVFDNEKKLTNTQNASYAQPVGDETYLKVITKHILEEKVTNNTQTIATAGGTGAIYLGIKSCLNEGDSIIMPEVAWGNYKVIAQENNLNVLNYDIYDINSLLNRIDECENKVFIVINSPSHNPCGHCYSYDQWQIIFNKINNCNKEVILLNDIAYLDYAPKEAKEYFKLFNTINDNVLVLLAYSCSKSFSYYGKRLGAFIAINNDEAFLDLYANMCTRIGRTTWSNVNHGAMANIASLLTNNYDEYVKERDASIEMLDKRSKYFIEELNKYNIPYYKYTSGFFVTLKIEELKKRDELHQKLIDNHIYTVKVNKGIRIGICSLSLNSLKGLAKKIADIY